MFIDRVKLEILAGKGGNGVVSWMRAKYIPKGGPTGGNGGKGGSIILQADTQIFCLEWYRHKKKLQAEDGRQGGPNQQTGRNGRDLVLKVPLGTLVKDAETGDLLHDFTQDQETLALCVGGKGGRGNYSFRTPTNQAPNICTPGRPGEIKKIELELKLIADIGLVGFPNAGKSTLINALAHVRVKIAPYPFTTLHPNIGFIQKEDGSRLFIADIPGIIENAHKNRGLGLEFLRHIERTHLLLFVLDTSGIDGRTPLDDYKVLRKEIQAYNPELLERPYYILLNKIDTEESITLKEDFYRENAAERSRIFAISALTGEGLPELLEALKKF